MPEPKAAALVKSERYLQQVPYKPRAMGGTLTKHDSWQVFSVTSNQRLLLLQGPEEEEDTGAGSTRRRKAAVPAEQANGSHQETPAVAEDQPGSKKSN